MAEQSKPLLCPSARCEEGASLLGIVQGDGTVAFTPDELTIDAAFVAAARRGRKPEARFRFASPCQRRRCAQWTGERCGVVDAVLRGIADSGLEIAGSLPACSIRAHCRWFRQSGAEACRACAFVVTELADAEAPATMSTHRSVR
jgi:hypothetical protein